MTKPKSTGRLGARVVFVSMTKKEAYAFKAKLEAMPEVAEVHPIREVEYQTGGVLRPGILEEMGTVDYGEA